jgi:ABC-type transporter Mla subunit MlaD
MTRRPSTSIVASPVLIGAVTLLVTIVAVFLAYNANQGLPFVPNLEVNVLAKNASAVGRGAEVREGGIRIGFVRDVSTEPRSPRSMRCSRRATTRSRSTLCSRSGRGPRSA